MIEEEAPPIICDRPLPPSSYTKTRRRLRIYREEGFKFSKDFIEYLLVEAIEAIMKGESEVFYKSVQGSDRQKGFPRSTFVESKDGYDLRKVNAHSLYVWMYKQGHIDTPPEAILSTRLTKYQMKQLLSRYL